MARSEFQDYEAIARDKKISYKMIPKPSTGSLSEYHILSNIGEGTYGKVQSAQHKETMQKVAIKILKIENERETGFPVTYVREIKILKELGSSENVVKLKEVIVEKDPETHKFMYCMIFELMDHDLGGILKLFDQRKTKIPVPHVKHLFFQLLKSLNECQKHKVLHRDLKPANLLLSGQGVLKLSDFGLARNLVQNQQNYTLNVVTRWYRSPELLLSSQNYSYAIDVWSAGCVLAEMLRNCALFKGKDDFDQIQLIWKHIGKPSKEEWPEFYTFRVKPPQQPDETDTPANFEEYLISDCEDRMDPLAIDLITKMLMLNPNKRITIQEAMGHDFFKTEPLPSPFTGLADLPHSYDRSKRPKEQRSSADGKPPSYTNPHGHPHHPGHYHSHHRGNGGRPGSSSSHHLSSTQPPPQQQHTLSHPHPPPSYSRPYPNQLEPEPKRFKATGNYGRGPPPSHRLSGSSSHPGGITPSSSSQPNSNSNTIHRGPSSGGGYRGDRSHSSASASDRSYSKTERNSHYPPSGHHQHHPSSTASGYRSNSRPHYSNYPPNTLVSASGSGSTSNSGSGSSSRQPVHPNYGTKMRSRYQPYSIASSTITTTSLPLSSNSSDSGSGETPAEEGGEVELNRNSPDHQEVFQGSPTDQTADSQDSRGSQEGNRSDLEEGEAAD